MSDPIRIETTNASGLPVSLEVLTDRGEVDVEATFVHPTLGPMRVRCHNWCAINPQDRTWGVYATIDEPRAHAGKAAGLTISQEDFDRAREAGRAALAAQHQVERRAAWDTATAACPAGSIPCTRKWVNGDLMSACYVTEDGVEIIGSDLLESHDGFYWIEVKTERSKQDAATAAKTRARDTQADAAAVQARATGEPVEVDRWMDECDESVEGCSSDLCVRVVLPDGTMRIERTHTY